MEQAVNSWTELNNDDQGREKRNSYEESKRERESPKWEQIRRTLKTRKREEKLTLKMRNIKEKERGRTIKGTVLSREHTLHDFYFM